MDELLREGLPEHIRNVLENLYEDLRRRAFVPIAKASSLATGVEAAKKGMVAFCEVWPAVQVTVLPWFAENPTRVVPTGQLAQDFWSTKVARRRLGDLACAEFAAAQDARLLIAHTVWSDLESGRMTAETAARYATIVPLTLTADYALLMGAFAVSRAKNLRPAEEVMEWLGRSGRTSARDAYATIAVESFSDRSDKG